ncbi:MAG: haloacid dehalogenase [Candidatus Heimdallarchaeota archaeon]
MVNSANFRIIANQIEKRLVEMDKSRDELLKLSRAIIKYSGQSIESFHNNQIKQAEERLEKAEQHLKEINTLLKDEKTHYQIGIINVAFQEYAEAKLLYNLVIEKNFPTVKELNITEQAYLLGIADLIGELRRFILEKLVEGKIIEAKQYYEVMKELYGSFLQIEYGKNLVQDFRRKKDTARVLLERTLSDLFVALQSKNIEEKIQDMSSRN